MALSERLAALSVVLVDPANGPFEQALLSEVQRALPGLRVQVMGAHPVEGEAPDAQVDLASADVIVAPWSAVLPAESNDAIARGLAQGAGVRLILPEEREGWRLLGAEALTPQDAARQAVQAIQEIAGGGGHARSRPNGLAIAGIVLGVLLLLQILLPLLASLLVFD